MNKKVQFLNTLKSLPVEDLKAKLGDSKARLQKLSFSHRITPLENPKILSQLRRDIARMKTLLNQQN